jgi:two-component system response regulator NreC
MRVLLADDHTLVRTGLRLLLETLPEVIVAGEAADATEALRQATDLRPDVVLMDLVMPGMTPIDAIREITERLPETRVLVVSMHAEDAYVGKALSAGAAGYLLKGADKAELAHALTVVARGETYISPAIARAVVDALRASNAEIGRPSLESLTARQREVLKLVAQGLSTRQVAGRLGVSAKTVEAHRAAIMDRLGIRDIAGLVRFAVATGLVQDHP